MILSAGLGACCLLRGIIILRCTLYPEMNVARTQRKYWQCDASNVPWRLSLSISRSPLIHGCASKAVWKVLTKHFFFGSAVATADACPFSWHREGHRTLHRGGVKSCRFACCASPWRDAARTARIIQRKGIGNYREVVPFLALTPEVTQPSKPWKLTLY